MIVGMHNNKYVNFITFEILWQNKGFCNKISVHNFLLVIVVLFGLTEFTYFRQSFETGIKLVPIKPMNNEERGATHLYNWAK